MTVVTLAVGGGDAAFRWAVWGDSALTWLAVLPLGSAAVLGVVAEAGLRGRHLPSLLALAALGAAVWGGPTAASRALDADGVAAVTAAVTAVVVAVAGVAAAAGLIVFRPGVRRGAAWRGGLAALAVMGLGVTSGLVTAVTTAPRLPPPVVDGPAHDAWERLVAAGTVEVTLTRSIHRLGTTSTAPPQTAMTDVAAEASRPLELLPEPIGLLRKTAYGVARWEPAPGGHRGEVDPSRLDALRHAAAPGWLERLRLRWSSERAWAGQHIAAALDVDRSGFPTRLVTVERLPDGVEVTTAVTYRPR